LSWIATFGLILVSRQAILGLEMYVRSKGYGSQRTAVIGEGKFAQSVAQRIRKHPSYGLSFIRYISGKSVAGIREIIKREQIRIVFVADKTISREKLVELAAVCTEAGVQLTTMPDIFQILTTSPTVENIDGLPMISLKQTAFNPFNRALKRGFDFVLSLMGIIIFSPLILAIAIFIKLLSPGPVLYKQERVGRKGEIFNLYKFRTMVPDAEKHSGPVLATADDPRKTLLGRVLRRTNLDELPQLINILKGEMSFVGPRPERPYFVETYKTFIPKYMERHRIKPGLAGWAQLHGGYGMPAEEKIKYDLYYIENWSLLLDIKIILKYIQIAFTFQRTN
jgi:exopolysaccharide biosynthesis polyprenyl glycosylphosphotransferase